MSKAERTTGPSSRHQKIMEALRDGALSWEQLRALTKINDEGLGFTIGELLNMRKIWTAHRGETRVYGIERRVGLVPRFANLKRRADDLRP